MAKSSQHRVNPFGGKLKIPAPKGNYKGPIPGSSQYVPPEQGAASAVDEAEAGAFRRVALGEELPAGTARSRRVSEAALDPDVMSAAQRRQRGVRLPESEDEGEGDAGDPEADAQGDKFGPQDDPNVERPEYTQADFDRAVQREAQRLIDNIRVKAEAAQAGQTLLSPTRAPHPANEFEPRIETAQRAANATSGPGGSVHDKSGLSLQRVSVMDVDRLWDWIRADGDGGKTFLGHNISTSLALHTYLQQIVQAEANGIALIRSLHGGEQHLGFAMLAPILAEERTAVMHIYLARAYRGHLAQIVGPLVNMAEIVAPGVHLAVWSQDDTWARLHRKLLAPLGFTERVMFIR